MKKRWRSLRYALEAALARAGLALLRRIGPVRASNLAGAVTRAIGPLLPVSRVADINLRHAMPELDAAVRRRIVRGVWENLGRTVGELPHIPALGPITQKAGGADATAGRPGYVLEGGEHLMACCNAGGPLMLFSAHIGCWEVLPRVMADLDLPMASFYRAATNPRINQLISEMRLASVGSDAPFFTKSSRGAVEAMVYLRHGGKVAMLVDQKLNEGIEARLFSQPAMTTTAAAMLALRFHCPLLPAHVVRTGPASFRVIVDPPLPLPHTGHIAADIATLTQAMNDCLERWIRAWPEGWLWLHRRFPQEVYRK
jgi:Kdo2-lipid IVA lauroyltransferase/acyltransferase